MNEQSIIRLRGVHKSFGDLTVLDGIDLDIHTRKTTVILGPSGCGKSVLLRSIIGLLKPDSGQIFFHDYEISAMNERALSPIRMKMSYLFQGSALFDSMTMQENICFPMEEHAISSRTERIERCSKVLELVGLTGLENRYPEQLSGGQKKRVALARAIVTKPEVILYDEPTTGLDPIRADMIDNLIVKLQKTLGTTAIVVTHDMDSAMKVADRIIILSGGKFTTDTTVDKIEQTDNKLARRFLNRSGARQK